MDVKRRQKRGRKRGGGGKRKRHHLSFFVLLPPFWWRKTEGGKRSRTPPFSSPSPLFFVACDIVNLRLLPKAAKADAPSPLFFSLTMGEIRQCQQPNGLLSLEFSPSCLVPLNSIPFLFPSLPEVPQKTSTLPPPLSSSPFLRFHPCAERESPLSSSSSHLRFAIEPSYTREVKLYKSKKRKKEQGDKKSLKQSPSNLRKVTFD